MMKLNPREIMDFTEGWLNLQIKFRNRYKRCRSGRVEEHKGYEIVRDSSTCYIRRTDFREEIGNKDV